MQPIYFVRIQRGLTLIEVLVTILILSIGLLGMAGLQSRLQMSEVEAYQRAQALLLLNDMANRIATNRNAAASYLTTTGPLGAGMTCPTGTSTQQRDAGEWCNALQGAGEVSGSSKLGAMLGGRGCVESLGGGQYLITVAWQGLTPLSAPPTGVSCGAGSYGPAGTACANDVCRRAVTTIVRVAAL
ncbi:type IV pilus modification protein PilV [Pseudomonas sp. 2FE]|uniref:type IV pilus modification protein PilV n=1 Tax=Pseudomonas sp. 2FE TaxID=2502190 RepID=UPI0014853B5A|nr:type IV pilus modification protein PilV [Pseudomonas sp. 2FE]